MTTGSICSTLTVTSWIDHVKKGLSWRESGQGDSDVFLPGLGGTRASWGPQLHLLSGQYRCVALDMPGYRESEPIEPLTYPAIASRLVDLLDLLAIERATLVGLSFGGMHALHATLLHPERVERLVLADTSPAFGIDETTRDEWVHSRLEGIDFDLPTRHCTVALDGEAVFTADQLRSDLA